VGPGIQTTVADPIKLFSLFSNVKPERLLNIEKKIIDSKMTLGGVHKRRPLVGGEGVSGLVERPYFDSSFSRKKINFQGFFAD